MQQFYFGSSGSMFALQVVIENVTRGMLLNTSRITLKCFYMRFGWLTPRRFFNYPYPYGRIGQPCGLGLSVTMCFKTLLRQTKILS